MTPAEEAQQMLIALAHVKSRIDYISQASKRASERARKLKRAKEILRIISANSLLATWEAARAIPLIDLPWYGDEIPEPSMSKRRAKIVDATRAEYLALAYEHRLEMPDAGERDSRMVRARELVGVCLGGVSGDAIEKSIMRLRRMVSEGALWYDRRIDRFTRAPFAEALNRLPARRGAPRRN